MRYRRLWLGITAIAMTLFCCGLIYLFEDGYYLPYKPCRPITYPDGDKPKWPEAELISFVTQDSIDQVTQFYDEHLKAFLLPEIDYIVYWSQENWVRVQLNNSSYVYGCFGRDINRLTKEQGCIYVDETTEGTLIEIIFLRFTEETFDCIDPIMRE